MTAGIARFAVALAGALTFSACLLGVDPEPKADPETVAKRDDAPPFRVAPFDLLEYRKLTIPIAGRFPSTAPAATAGTTPSE